MDDLLEGVAMTRKSADPLSRVTSEYIRTNRKRQINDGLFLLSLSQTRGLSDICTSERVHLTLECLRCHAWAPIMIILILSAYRLAGWWIAIHATPLSPSNSQGPAGSSGTARVLNSIPAFRPSQRSTWENSEPAHLQSDINLSRIIS